MKNTEEKEPLFRCVPEEMVAGWEKQNLTGQSITSLDGAYRRIKTLRRRVRVCSVISDLMMLVSAFMLVMVFGMVKYGSFTIFVCLAICPSLMIGGRFICWQSSSEIDRLQGPIKDFETHFKAIWLDGDPIQKVWDKESRLDQLLHITKSVLYYQNHKIPLARKDDRVSITRLVDMIDYYRFLKSHSKEYRLGLQRFGAYFTVPEPRALYDEALSAGMDDIIKIFEINDGFDTRASSKK